MRSQFRFNIRTLAEKYIFKHACYSKINRLLFLISRTCMPQCGILFHRCLFILEILIGSAILIYFVNKLILKGRKPMRRRQTAGKTPKESNAGDERVRGMVQQDGVPRGWHVLSVSTLFKWISSDLLCRSRILFSWTQNASQHHRKPQRTHCDEPVQTFILM